MVTDRDLGDEDGGWMLTADGIAEIKVTPDMGADNIGIASGGPHSGKQLSSKHGRIIVPIQTGPDRGEGDRGFSQAAYVWKDAAWVFEGDETSVRGQVRPPLLDAMARIVACADRALLPSGEVKTFQPIVLREDIRKAEYILSELRAAGFVVSRVTESGAIRSRMDETGAADA